MSRSSRISLVLLTALTAAGGVCAEVLKLGDTAPVVVHKGERPERGMSAEQVESRFGPPVKKIPPVGDPPIARWEYPGYTVYFEGRYVLHAVDHRAEGPSTEPTQP